MSDNANAAALSDLYRRADGTMRNCYHSKSDYSICLRNGCHRDGCYRANQILEAVKETHDV